MPSTWLEMFCSWSGTRLQGVTITGSYKSKPDFGDAACKNLMSRAWSVVSFLVVLAGKFAEAEVSCFSSLVSHQRNKPTTHTHDRTKNFFMTPPQDSRSQAMARER